MQARKQTGRQNSGESQLTTSGKPTLEEVLVGFQKSLARATLAAHNVSKADPDFSRGTRTLYVTEGLEVDLRVGLDIMSGGPGRLPDRIVVDFGAPGEARSSLKFRVGSKPQEYAKGPELVLASLNPVGETTPSAHYRLYLVDADRHHISQYPVKLILAPRDIDAEVFELELKTDNYGAVTFAVDGKSGSVTVGGSKYQPTKKPSMKGSVAPAWLLSAKATMKDGKELHSDIYVIQVYQED